MATISSPGIGSGLDVSTIITQLMAIERKPLDSLESAEKTIQTQISEVGKIKGAMSKLRDLAAKLTSTSFWAQTTGKSSNAAVSVTTGANATAANYSVQVTSLAAAQSIASPTFAASTSTLSAGTLHIELGAWGANQASFTPKAGATAVDITVAADDTLASVRDKINAAGAGVTATILTDSTGARLMLRSNATGAENAFRTTVSPTGGALDGLGYDPSAGVNGATRAQTAADAVATIDGLAVRSTTNTLTEVVDGVTMTLNSVTTSAATVSITPDTETIKTTLKDFAKAYSDLTSLIATDTKYDATNKKAGPLQGDSAITGLLNRLRGVLGLTSGASASFARLSDIGFEQQRDGTLTVNATRLDNAVNNLAQLKAAFSANDADASLDGFATRFRELADEVLGAEGALSTRAQGLADKLERNQDSQDKLEDRLSQTQARLEKQYSELDAKLGALNSLSAYVTQQVTTWNRTA